MGNSCGNSTKAGGIGILITQLQNIYHSNIRLSILTHRRGRVCRALSIVAQKLPGSVEAGCTQTVEDVVDTVVARVLQNLGAPQQIQPEWAIED